MILTGALQLRRGLLSSSSLTHVRFSSAFFCFVSVLSLSRSSVTVTAGMDYYFVLISGLTLVDYWGVRERLLRLGSNPMSSCKSVSCDYRGLLFTSR
ncbi:hypothetical protein HN51_062633, partial [Arachis hypogaea]